MKPLQPQEQPTNQNKQKQTIKGRKEGRKGTLERDEVLATPPPPSPCPPPLPPTRAVSSPEASPEAQAQDAEQSPRRLLAPTLPGDVI